MSVIQLSFVDTLKNRLEEDNPLIQVVLGPRQVGKTTGARQLIRLLGVPCVYASADKLINTPLSWINEQWQTALAKGPGTVLIIDEIQKIENWSEMIKRLWDQQVADKRIKLVLLGSSSLKLQEGLTESLTGRFELVRVYHWSWMEMKEAFGWDLEKYLSFGGYPGGAGFIEDYDRWYTYLKESIVETVIGKDILELKSVSRPALFRQAFEIFLSYPAQDISYTKLLGQLQDKGNTDLVKRYLELYSGAYLINTIHKYSNKQFKSKSSSPKILPGAPALVTLQHSPLGNMKEGLKGRLFELIVGMDLLRLPGKLSYFREGSYEVGYIYEYQGQKFAIEVKSERLRKFEGLKYFLEQFHGFSPVIISARNYQEFAEDPKGFVFSLVS